MNRKTVTILCAAGGLAAVAALLGSRVAGVSRPEVPPPVAEVKPPPVEGDLCGAADNSLARATATFGPGDMTAALSGSKILQGSDGELYLSIDLAVREAAAEARPPLNLAIVLDRSGSMSGEKITRAREAARGLVERLREGDQVALVQFDDVAEVLVPSIAVNDAGKARLLAAIESISDRGGTNIHGGMNLGRDEVLKHLGGGKVTRVILLSDGNANVGVTGIPQLASMASDASEKGVRISTIGLGLDYNEDLMEALAESGRGQYYYVKDAETLGTVFAGELKAIQSTVATRAELRLEPACAGVEIAEVFGYTIRRDGSAVIVPLSDLAGGDKRKVVARLKVPAGKAGHLGVVRTQLSYAPPAGGALVTTVAKLGVDVTADAGAVEASADKTVMGQVTEVQSAVSLRRAAEAYDKGDQEGAVRVIREQRAKASAAQQKYRLADKDMAGVYDSLDEMGSGMAANKPGSPAAPAMTKGAKAKAYDMSK